MPHIYVFDVTILKLFGILHVTRTPLGFQSFLTNLPISGSEKMMFSEWEEI